MIKNVFGETTNDIFDILIGYTVGDVEESEKSTVIRFDKRIENVIVSKRIMFDGNGCIFVTDDFILDILPVEKCED